MPTRNTGTALQDASGNNATKTHLSTNILIKVDGNVVGAVQSFSITEQRSIKMIDELGTDGHIDGAPTSSTNITGRITRARFNKQRLFQACGRSFIHLHAQRIPFDFEIQDIFADEDITNAIITVVQGVWFDNMTYDYQTSDYIITEQAGWQAKRIFSLLNNGNVVTSVGDGSGQPIIRNQFEQEADRGAFTGSLDHAGLLNAFLNDPRN